MAFLIDDIFNAIGKKKQAKAQEKAAAEMDKQQRAQHEGKEKLRGSRLGASNNVLKSLMSAYSMGPGGSGGPGPSYALGDEDLSNLQAPIPYARSAPLPSSAGAGWMAAGDVAGGLGRGLLSAYMGGAFGGAGGGGAVGGFNNTPFRPEDLPGLGKYLES